MKRTGLRQTAGSVAATPRSMSSRRRNRPGSAGTSLSLSSAHQAGWVKSPVATTPIPLRAAQWARCSKSRSRLVAREYFEWTCRSAWKRIGRHPVMGKRSPSRPRFGGPAEQAETALWTARRRLAEGRSHSFDAALGAEPAVWEREQAAFAAQPCLMKEKFAVVA